ncbi:MAG TPA: hypothetical protein VFN62_13495 [Acidobacteriaceae bacterium]|nr:hypothetical protein [Acidobacteriaceae bacterium]
MNATCKKYRNQAYVGFFFYGAMTAIAMWAVLRYPLGIWRLPVALTPMLPALFIARSIVRMFSSGDELQIKIHMQSLAFAFVGTVLLTLTYGFLQMAGVPTANWVWVWPLMGTLLLVGKRVAKSKYQ